jgi:hypothetical protein
MLVKPGNAGLPMVAVYSLISIGAAMIGGYAVPVQRGARVFFSRSVNAVFGAVIVVCAVRWFAEASM